LNLFKNLICRNALAYNDLRLKDVGAFEAQIIL
jgi:hypothetical protein